jgi:hypothetical protein
MQHSCSRTCQHVDETNVGQWNLYTKIDTYNLQCYNEKHDGSGKDVFRAWEERLDRTKVCFIGFKKKNQILLRCVFWTGRGK